MKDLTIKPPNSPHSRTTQITEPENLDEINAREQELPTHIWENIFSSLPISTILRMKAVSKRWYSILTSKPFMEAYRKVHSNDLYFVLFADYTNASIAASYNPIDDKWVFISLSHFSSSCSSTCCKIRRTIVSNGGLVLAEDRKGSLVVSNLFTKSCRVLPPMIPLAWPYVVAMLVSEEGGCDYKILAVTTTDKIYSQIYDSRSDSWEKIAEFDGRFAMLGNAVRLGGFLFCLSHGPDSLMAFDLSVGAWNVVEVTMPCVVCSYLLEHGGSLFLVGGIEEMGVMKRICIWELDESDREWRIVCVMPDHLFFKFGQGKLNQFVTVGCLGKICFYKNGSVHIVMYDLSEKRWWCLPACSFKGFVDRPSWFGLAVEPRLDAFV